MKQKALVFILIGLVLVPALFVGLGTERAQAQLCPNCPFLSEATPDGMCSVDPGGIGPPTIIPCPPPGETPTTMLRQKSDQSSGGWFTGWVVAPIINSVALLIAAIAAWLLGLSGMLLNEILRVFVVEMGTLVNNNSAINLAWELVRDAMNLVFIFLLLYIAITTILRVGFGSKKLLTRIIVAAILINFSLFITNVVIDVSNTLTVEFYQPIQDIANKSGGTETSTTGVITPGDGLGSFGTYGFTGAFMGNLGLTSIYGSGEFSSLSGAVRQIGGAAFMITAAFVFFAASLMFVVRFIVFILLLVSSPFAFVGILLPGTKGLAQKWWSTLWDQATWAPVFMLLSLIAFLIMQDNALKAQLGIDESRGLQFESAFSGESVLVVVNYIVILGFLAGALVISKKLSQRSAGALMHYANKVQGAGTSFAGRHTYGRLAKGAGWLYDRGASSKTLGRAGSFLDSKKLGILAAPFRSLDTNIRQQISKAEKSRFGGRVSLKEGQAEVAERTRERKQMAFRRGQDKKRNKAGKRVQGMLETGGSYDPDADEVKNFFESVGKITDQGLKDMLKNKLAEVKKSAFASGLTSSHIKVLGKAVEDGLISDTDKKDIMDSRTKGLTTRLRKAGAGGPARLDKELARLTSGNSKDAAALPRDLYFDKDAKGSDKVSTTGQVLIESLTPGVLSAIVGDNTLSTADRGEIKKYLEHLSPAPGTPEATRVAALKKWLATPRGQTF